VDVSDDVDVVDVDVVDDDDVEGEGDDDEDRGGGGGGGGGGGCSWRVFSCTDKLISMVCNLISIFTFSGME